MDVHSGSLGDGGAQDEGAVPTIEGDAADDDDAGGGGAEPDAGAETDGNAQSPEAGLPQDISGDAAPDGPKGSLGCTLDYQPCTAQTCCGHSCANGACGGCLAEGNVCTSDTDCCAPLSCTKAGDAGSFCGTNLCIPDGTKCGADSVPCCNDDCTNGSCGG